MNEPDDLGTDTVIEIASSSRFEMGANVLWEYSTSDDIAVLLDRLACDLADRTLQRSLDLIPYCDGLSYGFEMVLAEGLLRHENAAIQDWASTRVPDAVRDPSGGDAEARASAASRVSGGTASTVAWTDGENNACSRRRRRDWRTCFKSSERRVAKRVQCRGWRWC